MKSLRHAFLLASIACSLNAIAGPPYVSDDPEPTERGHFEIYFYTEGATSRGDTSGDSGIDFNYGAGEDLQLTAVVPYAYQRPRIGADATGVSNIQLAAKYRFAHQDGGGWDISLFPRVSLPSGSDRVGDAHAALFLPLWAERDWDGWSTFGGGGCQLSRGTEAKDFCLAGWALVYQFRADLQIGAELVHQGADTRAGKDFTRLGLGLHYDLNDRYHVLLYAGPGLENAAETGRYAWYAALLSTF